MVSRHKKIIAIIPARGGSKRIKNKNIVDLNGIPIITYPIKTAISANLFDEIIVSTDSAEIAHIAQNAGAKILNRSAELSTDEIGFSDVCLDVIDKVFCDMFCCIYATAAFIDANDIINAYNLFNHSPYPDVVMGVSPYSIHPYKALETQNGFLQPLFQAENLQQSQTYPKFLASNGTLYWSKTDIFKKT